MESDQPLVSVLMNCYNGEKYLRTALESILAQTYPEWELIFWDNLSTDGSAAICKSYGDRRIRYFCASQHVELGAARILAFQQARGDYIAVLDTDDVSHRERLMRQVQFLERNHEVALVGSWAHYIDEHGTVFGDFKPPTTSDALQDCLGWTNPIVHSSTMYRRCWAQDVGGYSPELVSSSDFGLVLALAQHFRIAVIDDFLCQLRQLPASNSRSRYRAIGARESLMLFRRAVNLLPLSERAIRLSRRAQATQRIKLGICRLSDGPTVPGLLSILLTLFSKPSVLWSNGPVRRFFGKPF